MLYINGSPGPDRQPRACPGLVRATIGAILTITLLPALTACQRLAYTPELFGSSIFAAPAGPLRKGGGRAVLGRPYWMFGRRYTPRHDPTYDRVGIASYFSSNLHGNRTANGELEDATALVAAHPTLPLPSIAEVTNLANGCRIFVRLNDRGPFVPGRIIDVSPQAARLLGFYKQGLTQVRLRYWAPAPLNGNDSFEQQYLVRYPDRGCWR